MAGKQARCKCGAVLKISPAPQTPDAPRTRDAAEAQINVTCGGCGRTHRVDASLAGKQARCKCGATLNISAAPVSPPKTDSQITVTCPGCGQVHQAAASMAGTQARCGCGQVVQIPAAGGAPSPAPFVEVEPVAADPMGGPTVEADHSWLDDETLAEIDAGRRSDEDPS